MVTLNKDTDLLILSRLDDNGLFSICLTNKYFNRLCKNEDLWRNRVQSRFSINGKKENETWKIFYLKKIYEETLIIGKLERIEWNKSPF
jgi:hypothetical protein